MEIILKYLVPLQRETAETEYQVVFPLRNCYHSQTVTPQLLKQLQLFLLKLLDLDNAGHNFFLYPSTPLVYLPSFPS